MKTMKPQETPMNEIQCVLQPVPELVPIFEAKRVLNLSAIDEVERSILDEAFRLYDGGFFSHALLNLWSAAVHNLRRKVEAFSIDMFLAAIANESGRKSYKRDESTLEDRWDSVDDYILVKGAADLGLLSPKAGKTLEIINWMRNHISAAHYNNNEVTQKDFEVFATLLNENLFSIALPPPGYSVSEIFAPVKTAELDQEQIQILADHINTLKSNEIRVVFEFLLSMIVNPPSEIALKNARELFPCIWKIAREDHKQLAGDRYYRLRMNSEESVPDNKEAADRLLYLLVTLDGVKYIPPVLRAAIFRKAVKDLQTAKDTSYGWTMEVSAAKALVEFGTDVPSIAFEEVYQEIFAVWCGNYWGRSNAFTYLQPFVERLDESQLVTAAEMFKNNNRVRDELVNELPNGHAVNLLRNFKDRIPLEIQKNRIDLIICNVLSLVGK